MLYLLRRAFACASMQTETLLVTLLLPYRPISAFTSLLHHPSNLHLTTVQHLPFLEPTLWTIQANCARAFRSGTNVIMVGSQQGYDAY